MMPLTASLVNNAALNGNRQTCGTYCKVKERKLNETQHKHQHKEVLTVVAIVSVYVGVDSKKTREISS